MHGSGRVPVSGQVRHASHHQIIRGFGLTMLTPLQLESKPLKLEYNPYNYGVVIIIMMILLLLIIIIVVIKVIMIIIKTIIII